MSGAIVAFGEVMGRINPPGFQRFSQVLPGMVELTYGGGEINVLVSLARFGANVRFVTALPAGPLADACVAHLRGLGVDTTHIVRTKAGRMGLYFLETGANQRAGSVVYDRDGSSVMLLPAGTYDWAAAFQGACWFHVTGITPALSERAAEATLYAVHAAKAAGLTVSCDLNFRKKLWRWDADLAPRVLAERTMRSILPYVDVVIANEEDADQVLSIRAEDTDVEAGKLDVAGYERVAREIVRQFPNVTHVAITLRESISASHNNWGAMLYVASAGRSWLAPTDAQGHYTPYEIRSIVDRVGGGDSFAAGLIYGLTTPGWDEPERAIQFAVAASCLKHSIPGDFNYVTREEVEALAAGQASGRVRR